MIIVSQIKKKELYTTEVLRMCTQLLYFIGKERENIKIVFKCIFPKAHPLIRKKKKQQQKEKTCPIHLMPKAYDTAYAMDRPSVCLCVCVYWVDIRAWGRRFMSV